MKYSKEDYKQTEFYGADESIDNHQQKIVKVRKDHKCCNCGKVINIGEEALHESCFCDGPQHAYTCISCCDKWLDEVYAEEREANA